MSKKRKRFKPPNDIKAFWLAPHCGPGTLDTTTICGFCGETVWDCAQEHSDFLQRATDLGAIHDLIRQSNAMLGHPEGDLPCSGSGFWCWGCGRFWANNGCGECNGEEHMAADQRELVVDANGRLSCVCGKFLMLQLDKVEKP